MSLKAEHLTHIYQAGTAMESCALRDVSFEIEDGLFVGLIGHTGSGKSTLIQHLNGLLRPSSGTVYLDGEDIFSEGCDLRKVRARVGLVFQYPEYQLFEQDVLTDVKFGPKNMGLSDEEAEKKAIEALKVVGLSEEYHKRSPFELSGGQKRRVAIAGVLSMEPKVLILDEPTAGLDPKGRDEILGSIDRLHRERGLTIILVSHSMEDVAEYADKLLVMDGSELRYFDTPKAVFRHYKELERMGLAAPQITYLASDLRKAGFPVDQDMSTVEEARKEIRKLFRGNEEA